jgi:hypothetical protein
MFFDGLVAGLITLHWFFVTAIFSGVLILDYAVMFLF